jgi:hypothetical protein
MQLKQWFPKVEPLKSSRLLVANYQLGDGDLANMMGLRDLIPEAQIKMGLKTPTAYLSKDPNPPDFNLEECHKDPFATEVNNPDLPKVVCFRDSFASLMQLFLSESCRRIRYEWRYDFPVEIIEREKPDVVIQEITERILAKGTPATSPEVKRCANVQILAGEVLSKSPAKLAGAQIAPAN